MRQIFLLVIFLSTIFAVHSIRCIKSKNGIIISRNAQCPIFDNFCATMITSKYGRKSVKRGCESDITWNYNFRPQKCSRKGSFPVKSIGVTGSVNCCDTNLCNSATTNYSFIGINILSIFLSFYLLKL